MPLWTVGVSTGELWRDSTGVYAATGGVLAGFRTEGEHPARALSVVELQATAWTLREHRALPDAGVQLSIGVGDIDADPKGSLGVRTPIVFSRRIPHGRVTLAAVPTVAWGHIRLRDCVDDGPGDNCGDLGIQLAFGRTRFLLAGAAGIGLDLLGVTLQAGLQQQLANGQHPRWVAGLSWSL